MTDPFIRPAEPDDVDAICMLLHTKMNRKIEPQRWRNLMTYEWLKDKPDLGRVVDKQGEILGYLGMVYADRLIDQRPERIVNICAWYLDKSLRGLGLGKSIMVDATFDPSMSYTIMTSSKNTIGLLGQVGYEILDDKRYVWFKQPDQKSPLVSTTDLSEIYAEITLEQKKLIDNHVQFAVTPVLVKSNDLQCLLIFSIKQKGEDITYFDLLYTSDRKFVAEFGQQLANSLLPPESSVLAVDCRFAEGHAVGAVTEKLPVARYVKSTNLSPENFDHLYTELQLLDLKLD